MLMSVNANARVGLKCTLKPSEYSGYPPHTKVNEDINGDGLKDIFYLAGEEDVFQTCIFLAEKSKSGLKYSLIHSHGEFYDSVLDLDGSGVPQILVAQDDLGYSCGMSPTDHIPKNTLNEIKKSYAKWSKGYEKYNFTYNMPDFYPLSNLLLLNNVKIYEIQGTSKMDVTKEKHPYLDLKKKILSEILKNKALPLVCKKKLEAILQATK